MKTYMGSLPTEPTGPIFCYLRGTRSPLRVEQEVYSVDPGISARPKRALARETSALCPLKAHLECGQSPSADFRAPAPTPGRSSVRIPDPPEMPFDGVASEGRFTHAYWLE